jgi:hypothetical protein
LSRAACDSAEASGASVCGPFPFFLVDYGVKLVLGVLQQKCIPSEPMTPPRSIRGHATGDIEMHHKDLHEAVAMEEIAQTCYAESGKDKKKIQLISASLLEAMAENDVRVCDVVTALSYARFSVLMRLMEEARN